MRKKNTLHKFIIITKGKNCWGKNNIDKAVQLDIVVKKKEEKKSAVCKH
jgi:hypothetical protein